MTHVVIELACRSCNHKFFGYFDDILSINSEYAAQCSKCSKLNTFTGKSALIDVEIPENSVRINYLKRL